MLLNPIAKERPSAEFQVDKTCRVCLKSEGECGLFLLNEASKKLISELFGVLVDNENAWKICVPCLKSIETAADFRKIVTSSDKTIKTIFQRGRTAAPSGQRKRTTSTSSHHQERTSSHERTLREKRQREKSVSCEPQSDSDSVEEGEIVPDNGRKSRADQMEKQEKAQSSSQSNLVPCQVKTCDRVFSLYHLMRRHYAVTHMGIPWRKHNRSEQQKISKFLSRKPTASATNSSTKRLSPVTESSSPNVPPAIQISDSPTPEPIVLKDLRINLVRCPDTMKFKVEEPPKTPEVAKSVPPKTTERQLPCPYCDKEYTITELSTHLMNCKGEEEPLLKKIKIEPPDTKPESNATAPPPAPPVTISHECDVCHFKFPSLTVLLQHRGSHVETSAVPLPVPQRHVAARTNKNESYKCKHCPKDFNMKWLLLRHLGVIHGIKSNKTEKNDSKNTETTSPKASSSNQCKLPALRVSSGVYDPKCIDGVFHCCDRVYSHLGSFSAHKSKYHPEQKSPKIIHCNVCHVKILDRKDLNMHYKLEHNSNSGSKTVCNICNAIFDFGLSQVYEHKLSKHPEYFKERQEEPTIRIPASTEIEKDPEEQNGPPIQSIKASVNEAVESHSQGSANSNEPQNETEKVLIN